MTQEDLVLRHEAVRDPKSGDPVAHMALTPTDDRREKRLEIEPHCVIPVIFIPGIMGTNLKAAGKDGRSVWRPPNMDGVGPILDAIGQLLTYLFKGPRTRQRELMPDLVEVDDGGPIEPAESGLSRQVLRARGWGALMRSAYQPVMAWLQRQLNHSLSEGERQGWWAVEGREHPADWGDTQGNAALTDDMVLHVGEYRFEVWAAGYNWLQSSRQSALDIRDYIENKVLPTYNQPGRPQAAQGVILVTHSMGGLVARALTEIHGYERVLGVVHGVQPATGAPATYKRMRAGFESIEQVILGRNAAEVTAVLANAPGGLELLPTADYNGGKPWLKVRDPRTTKDQPDAQLALALPSRGDPYEEIYLSDAWFGLVPRGNEEFLDLTRPRNGNSAGGVRRLSPRAEYSDRILRVQRFHADLSKRYHRHVFAHFGAERQRPSWGEIVWKADEPLASNNIPNMELEDDDRNGSIRLADGFQLVIQDGEAAGDGTVPWASGAAPGEAGSLGSFVHGQGQPNGRPAPRNADKGYDHQSSFNDDRARFASLYGIARVSEHANWHE